MMRLSSTIQCLFGSVAKMNAHQRCKLYAKAADRFQKKTLIRPPNMKDPNLIFPIKIPIRVRHIRKKPTEPLFYQNSSKIHWQRLSPNQILLAFQNVQYLQYYEMMEGLKWLSEIKGQQKHDWNQHPWVSKALQRVKLSFSRIKKKDFLSNYYLFHKLNYTDPQFWKLLYGKLREHFYELPGYEFQKFFMKYYYNCDQVFGPGMKEIFLKYMQNRLRQFKPENILKIYQIYFEQNRLDDYWKYNVFIPLFKSNEYNYTPKQVVQIFRNMLILNHEKDDRLYESLYKRIMRLQFKSREQIEAVQQVIEEVRDLFISHRVQSYIEYLQDKWKNFVEVKEQKVLTLQQIVKQDLIFFTEKKKIAQKQQLRN